MDIDVPYEPTPPGPLLDDHGELSGAVVVMAAIIPVPEEDGGGHWPALVFRFAKVDGTGFHPPMVLTMPDERLAKLRPILMRGIHDAREAAKAAS